MFLVPDSIVLAPLRNLGSAPIRIEWFGDVTYAGRFGGQSPLVTVVVARGHQGQWIRSTGGEDDHGITASIPVAYLRLLRVGDIWVLGRRVGSDTGSIRLTFPDILIDDTTTDIRPAGLPIQEADGESRYLLPFSEFDAHRGHTGAFCARVQLKEGITLVVPCIELIRFYFGASGLLLNRLFSGAFATDDLYTSARCHPITGIANLSLAPGLPFPAATTVARIAFDWRAEKAAAWIAKSGVAAAANGERYYPKTAFPFVGDTDLTVDGRWLQAGSTKVFFVARLLQCTHPFPFKRLYARSAVKIIGDKKSNTPSAAKKGISAKRTKDARSHDRTLLEGYVTRALMPMSIEVDEVFENPFPDLRGKPIHHMADAATYRPTYDGSGETDCQLTAGALSSTLGGRGAEVTVAQSNAFVLDDAPAEVVKFCAAFQKLLESGETAASLLPPLTTEHASKSANPFLRGDYVLSEPDERSREVWCAKISASSRIEDRHLVALVKPAVELGSPCMVALVHISDQLVLHDDVVRCACAEFAADGLSMEDANNLAMLNGTGVIDVEQLQAFLRAGLSSFGC